MLDKIKEKLKIRALFKLLPTFLFLAFIVIVLLMTNTGAVKESWQYVPLSFYGFEELSDSFEGVLQDNIHCRQDFIDLNGLTAKVLGINSLNKINKLANGCLCNDASRKDMTEPAERVTELNAFLEERDIPFVYLITPYSYDFYDVEFAPGYSSDASDNLDSMCALLDEAGINIINMDTRFEEKAWTMEETFFVTDHHWKPEAAMEAVRCTMEFMSAEGWAEYDPALLDESNWNVTVCEDVFLGSHGERTGSLYAGIDDISYYEPDFAADYTYSVRAANGQWYRFDNILNRMFIDGSSGLMDTPYNMYMYGDNPERNTLNTGAPNNKRVLLVGDSFKIPYEYFLTTQFAQVYTTDARYYSNGTVAQYIMEIQPDIVIMCTGSDVSAEVCDFGIGEYEAAARAEGSAVRFDGAVLPARDASEHFTVLYSGLEPGKSYTLTVDSAASEGGSALYTQMSLQDLSENTAECSRYFEKNCDEQQRWFFTVPDEPEAVYAIYLYAGTRGLTQNTSVKLSNIQLYEGVYEY